MKWQRLFFSLLFFCSIAVIFIRTTESQWDFWVYYDAARAWLAGLNPYLAVDVSSLQPNYAKNDFTYPPVILLFFSLFAFLPAKLAAISWLIIKLLALAFIARLLDKHFAINWRNWRVICLSVFAFNSAMLWDFASGNLVVLQTALLLFALLLLWSKKEFQFATLVAVVAQIKLYPIVFVLLLMLRKKWSALLYGILLFFSLFAVNFLAFPSLTGDFFAAMQTRVLEASIIEPSSYAFFYDLVKFFNSITTLNISLPSNVALIFYICYFAVICFFACPIFFNKKISEQQKALLLFVVLLLLLPRVKSYSYFMALPCLLFCLKEKKFPGWMMFVFLLPHVFTMGMPNEAITTNPQLGPIKKLIRLCFEYLPFMQTLFLFFLVKKDFKEIQNV